MTIERTLQWKRSTDGVDCSYICDIAVLPSHQGTGLGKQLVGDLVERSRGHRKIILYAVPGREPYLTED